MFVLRLCSKHFDVRTCTAKLSGSLITIRYGLPGKSIGDFWVPQKCSKSSKGSRPGCFLVETADLAIWSNLRTSKFEEILWDCSFWKWAAGFSWALDSVNCSSVKLIEPSENARFETLEKLHPRMNGLFIAIFNLKNCPATNRLICRILQGIHSNRLAMVTAESNYFIKLAYRSPPTRPYWSCLESG